jgi:hypothetical protein
VSSIPSGFRQTEPSAANDAWVVTISVLEALTSQDDYTDVAVTSQITPRRSRMRQRSATVEDVPARYRPNATLSSASLTGQSWSTGVIRRHAIIATSSGPENRRAAQGTALLPAK